VQRAGRHARAAVSRSDRLAGWLADRMPDGLRGRVRVGTRELTVILVLAALALTTAAVVVLRSGVDADPIPVAALGPGRPLVSPAASPGARLVAGAASPTAGGYVVVDVAGQVRRPGVIQLPVGSRVIDALRKAGGARPKVDLSTLNLARPLTDGEQILVGRPAASTGGVAGAASAASPATPGALVNLNSATLEQLETLPGVGPVTAQKILDWRGAHGRFSSVDELMEVSGIGEKTLARLAPYLTL